MTNEEFEGLIQAFWEKVQQQYAPYVVKGGILDNRDYYVFQTEYKYQPKLMIVVSCIPDIATALNFICFSQNPLFSCSSFARNHILCQSTKDTRQHCADMVYVQRSLRLTKGEPSHIFHQHNPVGRRNPRILGSQQTVQRIHGHAPVLLSMDFHHLDRICGYTPKSSPTCHKCVCCSRVHS